MFVWDANATDNHLPQVGMWRRQAPATTGLPHCVISWTELHSAWLLLIALHWDCSSSPNCATGLQPFCQLRVHWNPIQGCDSAFVPAGNRPPWMQTTLKVHYFQLLFVSWCHMWENIHCPQYMLSWTMYMVCELCVGHMVIWSWLS